MRSLRAGVLAVAIVSAACGVSDPAAPPPSAPPGGAVLVAQGIAFDRKALTVPAGREFDLLFENRDGALHNVAIYRAGAQPLFDGDTFGGPQSRVYDIPALERGTYLFRCDVHPQMTGTVTAS